MTRDGRSYGESPAKPGQPGHWTQEDRDETLRPIMERSIEHRRSNRPSLLDPDKIFTTSSRHMLSKIGPASPIKPRNTVVENWVPVQEELAAIIRGDGHKIHVRPEQWGYPLTGELFEIRRRQFVIQRQAHGYPLSGPGVHTFNEREYFLLRRLVSDLGVLPRLDNLFHDVVATDIAPDRVEFVWKLARDERLRRANRS